MDQNQGPKVTKPQFDTILAENDELFIDRKQELYQCKVCKQYLPADHYNVDRRAKSGRVSYCKTCRRSEGWGRAKYAKKP